MQWIKKGLIAGEENLGDIVNPQVPYAIALENKIRIFFGARRKEGGPAAIYYIDVDPTYPEKVLHINKEPILVKGATGAFDQDGVLPVCIKRVGAKLYLYYGGFSKTTDYPHTCMMGLAVSKDGGENFYRFDDEPVFALSSTEPYLIGSADMIFNNGLWHMIYTSGMGWSKINDSWELSYTLKYSNSEDGIRWNPTGQIVIPQETAYDAYAKPSIFKFKDLFCMYFSKRQIVNYRQRGESAYSLGFATSTDLVNWTRKDESAGIEASANGWDAEMICYPNIIEVQDRNFMFYNGNGFGKSGFGYAELVKKNLGTF